MSRQHNVLLVHFPCPTWKWIGRNFGVDVQEITDIAELEVRGELVYMSAQDANDQPGTRSLEDFEHPSIATYLFGPDYEHLPKLDTEPVYIPVNYDMLASQAACITMYKRKYPRG